MQYLCKKHKYIFFIRLRCQEIWVQVLGLPLIYLLSKEKSFTSLDHREITSSVKYVDPDLILESPPNYPSNPNFLNLPFPFPFGLNGLPEVDLNLYFHAFINMLLEYIISLENNSLVSQHEGKTPLNKRYQNCMRWRHEK